MLNKDTRSKAITLIRRIRVDRLNAIIVVNQRGKMQNGIELHSFTINPSFYNLSSRDNLVDLDIFRHKTYVRSPYYLTITKIYVVAAALMKTSYESVRLFSVLNQRLQKQC